MKGQSSYQALLKERDLLLNQLGNSPPILRGSLRRHMNRCGNPACRCHNEDDPVLHGPYQYLSHRYRNRTQTILLTKSKLPHAREWVTNYRRLIRTIYRLAEVNFRILRFHHPRLNKKP
jgi:hypothetical protein